MQREPTALPPTTFTICFTGTTHVRLDGIASRLKNALDSVVPELNLTRVGPPTIVVQSRESEEDFIPLSDYVPPPNSVTTSPEPHREPARSPTPPSECDQFNPADFPLPPDEDTDELEQQSPEKQESGKDAVEESVPVARDHFNHTRDELNEMFSSFDCPDHDAQNDKSGDHFSRSDRFSVYDRLSALITDNNEKSSPGSQSSAEQNHSRRRSASGHSSSDENEEMTFVYEGSSSVQSESKPKTSCLKKQKTSWSSDDDSREAKSGKKGDSEMETPRPCLKKSNSRGEDLSDRSRKSSLSSRGDSNKPHGSSSSRANYKSSFSDRNNNDRHRCSGGYNPGSHRGSSVFHRNGNRDERSSFRRGSRESDRDDFRRRDQDRAGGGREFRPREKRNASSEREVSVYSDVNRFGENDYASRRNEDRSFSRFRDGGSFQKYDARSSRDEHTSNHNRPHFADREHRSYGGQSYRREFRGEHCTRSGRGAFSQTSTDNHRRRRDRDSERNSDER